MLEIVANVGRFVVIYTVRECRLPGPGRPLGRLTGHVVGYAGRRAGRVSFVPLFACRMCTYGFVVKVGSDIFLPDCSASEFCESLGTSIQPHKLEYGKLRTCAKER
jgi:hypothetical protein